MVIFLLFISLYMTVQKIYTCIYKYDRTYAGKPRFFSNLNLFIIVVIEILKFVVYVWIGKVFRFKVVI